MTRRLIAALFATGFALFPLTAASASEPDTVVTTDTGNAPAVGSRQPTLSDTVPAGTNGSPQDPRVPLDVSENTPYAESKPGGPKVGPGSATAIVGLGLPQQVRSMWPSPGVELLVPNREVRVSFTEPVDSRTFTGQVIDTTTGDLAIGIDGAPALFTRSPDTKTEALDVIGTFAALQPGSYAIEWSVTTLKGKTVEASVPFTQLDPSAAPGASNHRHGDLALPGEKLLTGVARALIALAFGLIWSKRRALHAAAAAALALAGAIHVAAFAVPASETALTTAELVGRVDGWASAGVLLSALLLVLSRSHRERLASVAFAAVGVMATTYIPSMGSSAILMALLVGSMAASGRWVAAIMGWAPTSMTRIAAFGLAAAALPPLAVIVTAGTFTPDRGMGADLRARLLAAVVALALSIAALVLKRIAGNRRPVRVAIGGLAFFVVAAVATMTTAPALL